MSAAPALPKPITLGEIVRATGDVTSLVGKRPFGWHLDPRVERPDVLAFDLAAEGGFFFLGGARRRAGEIHATQARIDQAWIRDVRAQILGAIATERTGSLLVVVEDSHLGSAARTPLAFAAVTRYGAAVAAVCAELGLPMLRVPAQAWQSRVLGKIRRDQGKTLSVAVARRRFGLAITTDHVADAALLALFVRGGQ